MTATAPTDRDDAESGALTAAEARESRKRSFALLGELISPVKGQFAVMAVMVVIVELTSEAVHESYRFKQPPYTFPSELMAVMAVIL